MSSKKVERTLERKRQEAIAEMAPVLTDIAVNNFEERNFHKLVQTGVLVREEAA